MSITKDEASQALGEIEAARGRVWEVKAYGYASPFLIIWGLVWMAADCILQFEPRWELTWPIAVAVGAAASFFAGFSLPKPETRPGARAAGWRSFAIWFVVVGFIVSLFLVIPTASGRVTHSIFGLVFGFIYLAMGLWMGWRLAVLGAALVALTLVGFYFVGPWYALYMGLVSGGALLLGGLWLRRL